MKMNENSSTVYIEDYLSKKEGEKKWVEFWTILRGKYLMFYKSRPILDDCNGLFCGCIELCVNAKCVTAKRKGYSFPFYVITTKARYFFKTQSTISRHKWFKAIELASQGTTPFIDQSINNNEEQVITQTTDALQSEREESAEDDNDEALLDHQEEEEVTKSLVVVAECSPNQVTSFMERSRADKMSMKASDDVEITDLEENTDELEKRLHEIYCDDSNSSQKSQQKSAIFYTKPLQSQHYPSISTSSTLRPFSSRLTKSAESLRGMPITLNFSSYDHSAVYVERSITADKGSLLRNLGPVQNLTVVKSRFSRHLISSAPDVKLSKPI